jgi:uncharacterized membrane protein
MAKDMSDLGDAIGTAVGKVAREAAHSVSSNGKGKGLSGRGPNGALSGMKGVAAGAGLAAVAPLAAKGAGKLVKAGGGKLVKAGGAPIKKATDQVGKQVKDTVGEKIDEAGGPPGIAKEAGKGLLPGGGGGQKGTPGVGKGRRMPVQQAIDVGVPLETAYNQFTQFEEWPNFMHRLDQATQEENESAYFRTKIWGMSREFEAQIIQQHPDQRIMWNVSKGVQHTGVVTFHELADRLTRIQVSLDVEPGSLIEKAARGMRHVKRAVRADLARFKAYIEMQGAETGAWRGVIEDGEVVEEHPSSYDKGRDYADFEDIHDREHSHRPQTGSDNGRSGNGGSTTRRTRSSARGRSSGSSRKRSGSSSRRSSSGSSSRARSGGRSNARSRSGSSPKTTSARS